MQKLTVKDHKTVDNVLDELVATLFREHTQNFSDIRINNSANQWTD